MHNKIREIVDKYGLMLYDADRCKRFQELKSVDYTFYIKGIEQRKSMETRKTVSIKDVARTANVSLATVSRVINNSENVKLEMRELVQNTIRELGYSPNHAARSLVKRKTNCIGVVVNNLHDPFFYDLIKGFEHGAQQTKYNVIFCSVLGGDADSKENYVKYLTNGVVDGVVLYGSYLNDRKVLDYLKESNHVDYVMIENDVRECSCNKLLIDNYGGSKKAVEHLMQRGHKKIAHICGNPNKKVTQERMNGYLDCIRDAGLEIKEGYIQYTSTDYCSGYDKMKMLISLDNRPSAVFCSDDAIASFAVRAVMDSGLRVPEDVSIIGFDNQRILPDGYRGPLITSVEQPLYQIGQDSIHILAEQLEYPEEAKLIRHVYETKLIEKETVGYCGGI